MQTIEVELDETMKTIVIRGDTQGRSTVHAIVEEVAYDDEGAETTPTTRELLLAERDAGSGEWRVPPSPDIEADAPAVDDDE